MRRLTVLIPNKLRRDLEKLGREKQQPVSSLVRDSLRSYVAVEQFQSLRKKLVPLARAKGFFTDEDVFKALS
jgi:hypothetical protein